MVLSACSHGSGSAESSPPSPTNVVLTDAQRQHLQLIAVSSAKYHKSISTTGVVDFDNERATSVLAAISGPVSRLLVSPGDEVKKGQALAAVDSPDFATAISTYQKALATARTNRRLADLDKDLAEHNGVAQREATQAETDAVNAEADRDAALQGVIALNIPASTIKEIQDGRAVSRPEAMIRAPIAGTIVERLITPGQLLEAGTTPSFTIADLSRVWVMAQVFGTDLASVHVGDTAKVTIDGESSAVTGRVDNIAALVDADTRSVAVRIVVDNPARLLKKQMYVHTEIESRQETTGTLVPVSSILRDDENLPFVYLSQADGSFARQHVTLKTRTGDSYDIAEGLKAGDRIVVDGGLFVQFMQNQ
jgi:membrane fusion protein, heavy metal efflux system